MSRSKITKARVRFKIMLDSLTDDQCESLWSLVEVLLEDFKPVPPPTRDTGGRGSEVSTMGALAQSIAEGTNGT